MTDEEFAAEWVRIMDNYNDAKAAKAEAKAIRHVWYGIAVGAAMIVAFVMFLI